MDSHNGSQLRRYALATCVLAAVAIVASIGIVSTLDHSLPQRPHVRTQNVAAAAAHPLHSDMQQDQEQPEIAMASRSSVPPSTPAPTPQRFAYMLYVTSDTYACAALHLLRHLLEVVHADLTRIDIVVLYAHDAIHPTLLRRLRDTMRARTIGVDLLVAEAPDPTWALSLTKLRVFQDWGYDRVVFLDADAVPMRNLDHLFELPPGPLYAPTAYWLEQPFFASTVLVIEPSNEAFKGLVAYAHDHGAAAGFDMDILNVYFADAVQHLPGDYTVLNSDFRAAPGAPNKLYNSTTELKAHAQVVHFSCKPDGSYGKPWQWPSHDLTVLEGMDLDPLFAVLFTEYWTSTATLCAR